jgi:hypothetical protein
MLLQWLVLLHREVHGDIRKVVGTTAVAAAVHLRPMVSPSSHLMLVLLTAGQHSTDRLEHPDQLQAVVTVPLLVLPPDLQVVIMDHRLQLQDLFLHHTEVPESQDLLAPPATDLMAVNKPDRPAMAPLVYKVIGLLVMDLVQEVLVQLQITLAPQSTNGHNNNNRRNKQDISIRIIPIIRHTVVASNIARFFFFFSCGLRFKHFPHLQNVSFFFPFCQSFL